jgi:UDP-glucose 4-epimerase
MESILLPGGLGYIGSVTTVYLHPFLAALSKKTNIKYKVLSRFFGIPLFRS